MKLSDSKSRRTSKDSGIVRVAIWKENPEIERHQDVFTNYSMGVFYDFSRPLKLLDSPGWSSSIRTRSEGDFFVFSSDSIED